MTLERIRAAIIEVTTQIQSMSQRDVPPLQGGTRIIGDVPGFDSLNAVELTIMLTDVLAMELGDRIIPDRIILGAGKSARPTIDEIAGAIKQYAEAAGRRQKRAA